MKRVWVKAERWEHGLELTIFDEEGAELGATQTHDEFPATAGEMVRDWVAVMYEVPAGHVEVMLL